MRPRPHAVSRRLAGLAGAEAPSRRGEWTRARRGAPEARTRIPRLVLALILCLAAATGARAADLKIATWNLNWLTRRQAGLPEDVTVREPADFDRLRAYAKDLNADVVALQEVDGPETARLLFPPDRYSIHMTHDHVRQRVGFAVRRGLTYAVNPDVTAIALDPRDHLRSGADITLRSPAGPLRILTVHLKEGCQYVESGRRLRWRSCRLLMAQFDAVDQWIAARRTEGVPFLVLGDFNRDMDGRDRMIAGIEATAPMIRATEGFSSPCWGGHHPFIDHILLGGPARSWLEPNSLRVLTYKETDPAWKARLSDHCPVSVRLDPPG
jgi:endonuclease/exonuclease/phosphatase family metal-dependent hydrolase